MRRYCFWGAYIALGIALHRIVWHLDSGFDVVVDSFLGWITALACGSVNLNICIWLTPLGLVLGYALYKFFFKGLKVEV